jgi:acyl-CoA reductase-like NAD-dependent aldehyde dehydrogenase
MPHAEMLLAGHFLGGPCDQAVGKSVLKNPWDGSTVGTAAEGGWQEAEAALEAAHEAFSGWSRRPAHERAELLAKVSETIRERRAELAELLVDEIGKPITWAFGEVDRMAVTFELSAKAARELGLHPQDLAYDLRGKDYEGSWGRAALGPALCIVPWNWPFNLAAHKIGPALAVGNTVVLKPSGLSPISSLTLARIVHECGCPPGVLNAVNVPGKVAERLAQDGRVKKVSFTGSAEVGWKLKELLPRKKVTLELGSDSSVIVMPDADLDWAAERAATSAFGYAGQVCISAQHVWAHADAYDAFKEKLIRQTEACPTGDPKDAKTVCGPLIHAEAADRVESWIAEAEAKGAKALVRGKREGNTLWPTLMEDVPREAKLGCEEVFGPVLTLQRVADLDEAFERVNASPFGIHASIFTSDLLAQERAFRELEVGGVVVNDFPSVRFDDLPYGGVEASGFGREGVRFGVEEMSQPKSFVRRI